MTPKGMILFFTDAKKAGHLCWNQMLNSVTSSRSYSMLISVLPPWRIRYERYNDWKEVPEKGMETGL